MIREKGNRENKTGCKNVLNYNSKDGFKIALVFSSRLAKLTVLGSGSPPGIVKGTGFLCSV